jgi:tellurite resistance protein TehA-like permease
MSERRSWLEAFPPAAFAMVMATGIVSIAARLLGYGIAGWALLGVNAVAYPAFLSIAVCRLVRYPHAIRVDIGDHGRGPGFLALVAGTAVFGSQIAAYDLVPAAVPWLLGLAIVLWVVIVYAFLAAMTIGQRKPGLQTGFDGTWLLLVVATEAIAILATFEARLASRPAPLAFLSLAAWLLGCALYVMLITLIFYRWCFVPMSAAEMTEPWWINMGAMAIAAFAGSRLILLDRESVALPLHAQAILYVLTTACWAMATFWIPLLVILFIAKHGVQGDPIHYTSAEWSMVFPLGMYTAATYSYAHVASAPFLSEVPRVTIAVAFVAWVLAAIGMLHTAFHYFLPRDETQT